MRELEEHMRRFETPPTESGEEVKGKGKGAIRACSSGGQEIPFENNMQYLL